MIAWEFKIARVSDVVHREVIHLASLQTFLLLTSIARLQQAGKESGRSPTLYWLHTYEPSTDSSLQLRYKICVSSLPLKVLYLEARLFSNYLEMSEGMCYGAVCHYEERRGLHSVSLLHILRDIPLQARGLLSLVYQMV